jgi:hypothetical protein
MNRIQGKRPDADRFTGLASRKQESWNLPS